MPERRELVELMERVAYADDVYFLVRYQDETTEWVERQTVILRSPLLLIEFYEQEIRRLRQLDNLSNSRDESYPGGQVRDQLPNFTAVDVLSGYYQILED